MKDGRFPCPSVGIDLVEYARARALWLSGGVKLRRILTAAEWRRVSKSRRPERELAAILAAKEAVFKTLGRAWMGPDGFRSIRIPSKRLKLQRTDRYVVATCAGT